MTKTEDETVGGDKTFTGDVTLSGDNVVSAVGSLEVPSVLDNVGSNGTLNLSTSTGTGDCEQAVNFCDLQTVYNSMLDKFNALNDQIDGLLDSIKDLNKQLSTPKDGEACPNSPTVSDNDGNTYSTVRIGNQCWMRENLRTTRRTDGTKMTLNSSSSSTRPYYKNPAGGASEVPVQGYLYNYVAASDSLTAFATSQIRGICPPGWHIPTQADWSELITYLNTKEEYKCDGGNNYIAKALSSPLYWPSTTTTCAVGNNPEDNNATGFSSVPAYSSNYCYYWASQNGGYTYWQYSSSNVSRSTTSYLSYFRSIRCLRDNSNSEANTVNAPTVETIDSVKNVTQNSAWVLGGKITDNGGMPIKSYGFVVGTSASVTYGTAIKKITWSGNPSLPKTMEGSTLNGLTTNTQYYYRAYAVNAIDTAYGEAKAFHTVEDGQPCPGLATVTDIDGNTYNTVMIGSQCWLKENMKATRYATNMPLVSSTESTSLKPYYTSPEVNANIAGLAYNWSAAMRYGSAYSVNTNPSGVMGICPAGWHVPSNGEFQDLINYVNSHTEYQCGGTDGFIAKALASTAGWQSSNTNCTVGNTPSNNDATGFSLVRVSLSINYGRLYSNNAAMNGTQKVGSESVQGICPSGWHLPSEAEVNTLKSYLSTQSGYMCNSNTNNIAKSLASKAGWTEDATTCAIGNNLSANNATGFNAYPAGCYNSGSYASYGLTTHFILDETGKHLSMAATQPYCYSWASGAEVSVRCIKGATPPSVATNATVTDRNFTSATVGGSLYTDSINSTFNASSVTQLGICYGTSPDPTTANGTKTVTVAKGAFTAALTGLSRSTTYYYRAYATNANGTSYGEVKQFTTKKNATVSNHSSSSVTKTSVTLTGYITQNDATITNWAFALYKQKADGTYDTDPNNHTLFRQNSSVGVQSGTYSFTVTGLDSGTSYKYRAWIYQEGYGWITATSLSNSTINTLATPTVTTTSASYSGSGNTFLWKGNVTSLGSATNSSSFEKGFVYGDDSYPVPTLTSNFNKVIVNGATTGEYTYNATLSTSNKTWYIRAYVKNDVGVNYGDVVTLTTPSSPSASFAGNYESPYNYSAHITQTTIQLQTSTTSTAPLLEKGLLYTSNPTSGATIPTTLPSSTNVNDATSSWVKCVSTSTNSGNTNVTISGLQPNTNYYIVSYAKSPFGTTISSTKKMIRTKLNCGQILTDQQGNNYGTISRGGKCWMMTNMRAYKYDSKNDWSTDGTGTVISRNSGTSGYISYTTHYAFYPNNNSSNVNSYGYLYNWAAATGYGLGSSSSMILRTNTVTAHGKIQGICPRGWHIPTTSELTTLRNNISGSYSYFNQPAEKRMYNGNYTEFNTMLNLWSSTENDASYAGATGFIPATRLAVISPTKRAPLYPSAACKTNPQ